MKSNLIKAVKSLALFLLILFVADRVIGKLLESLYFKQKTGGLYQTTYAINKAKQDLLIFGASRAMHHYVSNIFEQKLHLSTYNLGRDGRNMLYDYAILSQVLSYHHPSLILLDVQCNELSWKAGREGEDAMIYALLPYAEKIQIEDNISKIRKSDLILSKVFKTYAYNSIIAQIIGYNYGILNVSKNIKGYEPLKGSKLTKLEFENLGGQKTARQDGEIVNCFKAFLTLARKSNIKVDVIVSPIGYKVNNNNAIGEIKKITENYGFKFYNFSNLQMFKDYKLFYDGVHLNDKGATLFTQYMANQLSNEIDSKSSF